MELGDSECQTHKLLTWCQTLLPTAAGRVFLFTPDGDRVTVNDMVTCGQLTLVAATLPDGIPLFGRD